jgi:hypothetical protein
MALAAAVLVFWGLLATPVEAAPAAAGAMPAAAGAPPVAIRMDRTTVQASVGQRFELVSTIENQSGSTLRGLIAHIDVVGTDPARYVDPEDWCTARTVFLDDLKGGSSADPRWQMQAVDSGPLLVWVTVSRPAGHAVAVGAPVHLDVGQHLQVNVGGVLPVVIGVPAAVVAGLALVTRWRRSPRPKV